MSADEDAGHAIERSLRFGHRCGPRCLGCRVYRADLRPETLVERFGKLVAGESGWRYARAHAENGLPFPQFSIDPHEQFLVCEALSVRYEVTRQQAQADSEAREQARADAEARLKQHREERH